MTIKKDGLYETIFNEEECKKYVLDVNEINNNTELPKHIIVNLTLDGPCLKLFKPYGDDVGNHLAITWPEWNEVSGDCNENDLALKTKLNDFQTFIYLWKMQLSEITSQTNNLLHYLLGEYERLNTNTPPFPSPISIRTLKTAIFQNGILYIEAAANFLSALSVNINNGMYGAPIKKGSLGQDKIDKLQESKRFIRLEDKLISSVECLSHLLAEEVSIDTSNYQWGRFKEFKRKRDQMTHVKNPDHGRGIVPTLDYMIASVKINDKDIFHMMELLHWFGIILNTAISAVGINRLPFDCNFNDVIVDGLVDVSRKMK